MSDNLNYKIILLGDQNVGKTAMINRYLTNSFNFYGIQTTGMNIENKEVIIDNNSSFFI